jgi:uncharacterized membrane protein HdeD (DUF308 family)
MFRSNTTTLVVQGILAIIIGVVSVAWPEVTVGAFVILFAVYAFMTSIADAVRAFSSGKAGHVVGYLLLSLLSLVAGVVALAWPGITALVLTIWIGAWALVTGVIQVAMAFRSGEGAGDRALCALGGLVSIALGVVLTIHPQAGAVSLAIVFGLFSMVTGVNALVLATLSRRTPAPAERDEHLANSAG